MHNVVFCPVGNGDSSQIVLQNGRRLLFDYHHQKKSEEVGSTLFNLSKQLKNELKKANRDDVDVLALTHGDDDHIAYSTEFFQLWHAAKYQGDGRIKIGELWVPAAMVLEPGTNEQQSNEVIIWRQEARYRLKHGKGIRVFSKPEKLKGWLEANGLPLDRRRHLITDAGQLVPGFTLANDGGPFGSMRLKPSITATSFPSPGAPRISPATSGKCGPERVAGICRPLSPGS